MTTSEQAILNPDWQAHSLFHSKETNGWPRLQRGLSALRAVTFLTVANPAPYPIVPGHVDLGDLHNLLDIVGRDIERGLYEAVAVNF